MKKEISIALCLLLILISTTVFASTPVKMEIVENNIDEKDIPLDLFVSFYEMHIGSKLKSFSFYKRLLPLNEHA